MRAAARPVPRIARLGQGPVLALREQQAETRGNAGADGRAPARAVVTIVAENEFARAGRELVDERDEVDDGDTVMCGDLCARDSSA